MCREESPLGIAPQFTHLQARLIEVCITWKHTVESARYFPFFFRCLQQLITIRAGLFGISIDTANSVRHLDPVQGIPVEIEHRIDDHFDDQPIEILKNWSRILVVSANGVTNRSNRIKLPPDPVRGFHWNIALSACRLFDACRTFIMRMSKQKFFLWIINMKSHLMADRVSSDWIIHFSFLSLTLKMLDVLKLCLFQRV